MKKIIALLTIGACALQSAYAIKIVAGPYIQQFDENSATIVWATDVDGVSWVEVAPDEGSHFMHRLAQSSSMLQWAKSKLQKSTE